MCIKGAFTMKIMFLIPRILGGLMLWLALLLGSACAPPEIPPAITAPTAPAPTDEGGYVAPVAEAAPLGTAAGETIASRIITLRAPRHSAMPAQVAKIHYSADPAPATASTELRLLNGDLGIRVLRDNGTPFPIHQADGKVQLQGEKGARYVIEATNNSPTRTLEVVLVIDGILERTGRPINGPAKGMLLRPGGIHRFEGFRKNDHEVEAFRFADAADSVAVTRGTGSHAGAGLIRISVYDVTILE